MSWTCSTFLDCSELVDFEPFEAGEASRRDVEKGYESLEDYVAAAIEVQSHNGVCVFKVGWDVLFALSATDILAPLLDRVCFIWCRRRDKILQAVSHMRAQRSARYIELAGSGEDSTAPALANADLPVLLAEVQNLIVDDGRLDYFLQLHGYPALEIFYEDIEADMQAAFDRVRSHVSGFLGRPLPAGTFRPRSKKQADGSEVTLRQRVVDWLRDRGFMSHQELHQPEGAISASAVDSPAAERGAPAMVRNLTRCFWAPPGIDVPAFSDQLQSLIRPFGEAGSYAGDNLVVFGRNLGFLRDEAFLRAFRRQVGPDNEIGYGLLWRLHVFVGCAQSALRRRGDLVECGVSYGLSSAIMCEYLDFARQRRSLFLYDSWGADGRVPNHYDHSEGELEQVKARFGPYPNVKFVPGFIPESFSGVLPEAIAFLHIDLNSAEAEIATLDHLFHLVVPGGIVLFDDYGHNGYAASQAAEDAWAARRGYQIMELPTGQGLLIK